MTRRVKIWTDGACSGNPGPGGYGAILRFGEREKELSGGEPATTNNRMELMAAIVALEALTRPCAVDLHTDSQYVRNGVTSVDRRMEGARMENRRQKAGQERGALATARRGVRAARRRLALGQGPRRRRNERASRRARPRGNGAVLEEVTAWTRLPLARRIPICLLIGVDPLGRG